MQLLLVPAHKFSGGFDQGAEGESVQRFGVLFVAAHGPWPHQGGLGFAVLDHGHSPAVVVFVLDDFCRPAVTGPKAGLLGFGTVRGRLRAVCGSTVLGGVNHNKNPIWGTTKASSQCVKPVRQASALSQSVMPASHASMSKPWVSTLT